MKIQRKRVHIAQISTGLSILSVSRLPEIGRISRSRLHARELSFAGIMYALMAIFYIVGILLVLTLTSPVTFLQHEFCVLFLRILKIKWL